MVSTLCRSSSMPVLWRLMSSNSKPAVVKVAGKELKIINDVTAVPNSQIFEKESTKTHLAQISKIESDISPKDMYTISGMPKEHIFSRRVRIYKEAKNAMQSGTKNTHTWKMEFENRERWENPLMGWTSTGDPVSNLTVKFNNIDEAIAFCEKNNWFYAVEDIPPERKPRKKSYADNFSWNKRTRVGSK